MEDTQNFKREQLRFESLALVSQFFNVSYSAVELWVKDGMPRVQLDSKDGNGKRQRYHYQLDDIMKWWLTEGPGKKRGKSDPKLTDPDEALLLGADTPEMEKLRRVKRKHAELDYAERLKELVAVEDLLPVLHRLASMIRRWVERLSDQYGPKVVDSFDEVLDEFRNVINNEIGTQQQPNNDAAETDGLLGDPETTVDEPVG